MDFRINRVYTRGGDNGETGLVGGRRVRKTSQRVIAFGDIDELNSQLGVVKAEISKPTAELAALIEKLQQQLFDLGSEIATDPADVYPAMWQVAQSHVDGLEALCDQYGKNLTELQSFILPGGTRLAAALHVARCVCRRAERSLVSLSEVESINKLCIPYLNRVSDLLFVLARWSLELEGVAAPLWVKEGDR